MNSKHILILVSFSLVFFLGSCGSDAKSGSSKGSEASAQTDSHAGHDHSGHDHAGHDHSSHGAQDAITNRSSGLIKASLLDADLPGPCTLLDSNFVKSTLGLSPTVNVKEGTKPDPKSTARACFFRWNDPNYANSAIMIQVMKNPLPGEEYEDWAFYYIDSKKSNGESSINDPEPIRFEKYDDLGDSGAANDVLKKYYWQVSNKLVFMIAYNTEAEDAQMRKWTKILGDRMMENYNKI